jgi:probable HAF family extracellular repeat protein
MTSPSSSPAAHPRALLVLAATLALAACADRHPVAPPPAAAGLDAAAPAPSAPSGAAASSPWHIELGTMGGIASVATGLNEAGQVTGTITFGESNTRAFVWTPASPGAATGTMVALPPVAGYRSEAAAINESGAVAGFSSYPERATVWVPTDSGYVAVDLGMLQSRYPRSRAEAINDAGQVAGMSHEEYDWRRAILWTPSSPGATTFTMRILGDLGGNDGVANGINNAGQVVGAAYLAAYSRAFIWKPGAVRVVAISSMKTPGDSHHARGINDVGEVVGWGADLNASGQFGSRYAWVWTPFAPGATTGTRRRLAPEASSAHYSEGYAINTHGQVAGVQRRYDPARVEEPVVWTGGVRRVLYLPPGHQGVATAIADDGRVAGRIKGPDGKWRAVLWHALLPAPAVTAALAAPASPVSGHTYTYDASASVHSDGRPLTFHWDLDGDGTTDRTTGTTPSTTLALRAGTHTVRVIATADGLADTAQATVTVAANAAPVAQITGVPAVWPEGALLGPSFTVSDGNPQDSTFTYRWSWGDGTTSAAPTKRYADQGRYEIRLVVRDGGGLADTAYIHADVVNAPPTAAVGVPASTSEGAAYAVTISSPSDPGTADRATLQFAFDCGRGEGYGAFGTTRTATCPALADQDTFQARAKVRDKDGAETEYVRTVRVVNARPVVQAQLADSAAPQGPVAFRFTDGGTADGPWEYRVRRGNGTYTAWMPATPGAWITTPAYAYPSGTHAEAVYVRDKDGGIGYSAPVTLTVP